MLTSKHIKKVARLMSQTSGHGSCYPYRPPLEIEIADGREPSEFVKEILCGVQDSVTADLKRHLDAGRSVHGINNEGKRVRLWRDENGEIQSEQLYDPAERAREKQASRDEDQRRLAGEITQEELRKENGRVYFPGARIILEKRKRLC